MEDLLGGRSLVWASADPLGVFTAATHKMLLDHFANQSVRVQLIQSDSGDELAQTVQRQVTGLVTLVLQQASEIPSACKTLWRLRGRLDQPVCVSFIAPELIDHVPLLLESGAQVVVSQLDAWQRVLPRVLSRAPLSQQGFHPITAGLIERLPWPEDKHRD